MAAALAGAGRRHVRLSHAGDTGLENSGWKNGSRETSRVRCGMKKKLVHEIQVCPDFIP